MRRRGSGCWIRGPGGCPWAGDEWTLGGRVKEAGIGAERGGRADPRQSARAFFGSFFLAVHDTIGPGSNIPFHNGQPKADGPMGRRAKLFPLIGSESIQIPYASWVCERLNQLLEYDSFQWSLFPYSCTRNQVILAVFTMVSVLQIWG